MSPRNFEDHLELLSTKSVSKHFDAYADIDWDAHDIRADDPRFILSEDDSLGRTQWYRELLPEMQSQLGLHRTVLQMHLGATFENVLSHGLLTLAASLPCTRPEVRYAYHEVIEESQHTLMFHEFVRRSGFEVFPLPRWRQFSSRRVPKLARHFPELFFVFVLAGETPIDQVQRKALKQHGDLHPLLERIMRIHVTEEARHLSFAHRWLDEYVPTLSTVKRTLLALLAPHLVQQISGEMLHLSAPLVRSYGIPKQVVHQVRTDPVALAERKEALAPLRRTFTQLGLFGAPFDGFWRRFQLA